MFLIEQRRLGRLFRLFFRNGKRMQIGCAFAREFYQLWRSNGGAWEEALDWSQEDPRTSALQRQLSEVARWLNGQTHKLATAQEALAVQELVEAMLGYS